MLEGEPRRPQPKDAVPVPEKQPSERETIWQQKKMQIDQITDGLGLGIEEGIKEAVIVCQVHGMGTSASCEGHLNGEGMPYPWIDITAPAPDGWRESEALQERWRVENMKLREKMRTLLEGFYSQSQPPTDAQLVLVDHGIYGAFRLQSRGAKALETIPAGALASYQDTFAQYRQEMNAFVDYLKQNFFEEL